MKVSLMCAKACEAGSQGKYAMGQHVGDMGGLASGRPVLTDAFLGVLDDDFDSAPLAF